MTDPALDPIRIDQLHAYAEGGLRSFDPMAIATASAASRARGGWPSPLGRRWLGRLVAVGLVTLLAVGAAVVASGYRSPTPLEVVTPTLPANEATAPSTGVATVPTAGVTTSPETTAPPLAGPTALFTLTGALRLSSGHLATALDDGRVLVIGGESDVAEAWLWDPATGRFTRTGAPAHPHGFGIATQLPDGRILVAGGSDFAGGGTADAEIFDPQTGQFSPTGSMLAERGTCHCGVGYLGLQMPHAAVLQDGRVFVIGGQPTSGVADIYDPGAEAFTQTPIDAGCDRSRVLPVTLATGDVLVKCLGSAWLYHPQTDTMSQTGSPATSSILASTLLDDGGVLFTGHGLRGIAAHAEIYDPDAGTFRALSDPINPLTAGDPGYIGDPGERLPDGRVFFADDARVRLFDPATETFSLVEGGPLRQHNDATTTGLTDGRVLIVGPSESDLAEPQEVFDPSALP